MFGFQSATDATKKIPIFSNCQVSTGYFFLTLKLYMYLQIAYMLAKANDLVNIVSV